MTLGKRTGIILLSFQIAMIIAFAFLATYSEEADVKNLKTATSTNIYYPMFQDIQVMVIAGFSMLLMYMKRYSYSGSGLCLLISALTFQYGLLLQRITGPLNIGMKNLINADITAVTVLISMGAIFGRTTPLQLLIMTLLEVPAYIGNQYLTTAMNVVDTGGSVIVHAFGAYFGMTVSKILGKPKNMSLEASCYHSDLFSVAGTLFLWIFWPSFNGALSFEGDQQRAVINTYLALIASCTVTFAISSLTNEANKFTMAHIQNATLAGGVAIGTAADLMLMPYAALIIGGIGGALTTLGFVYLQPWILKRLDLHDTCGVHNLHGLPAILAAIVGTIAAAQASEENYGPRLYLLFPARAPFPSTKELRDIQLQLSTVMPGELRSASKQASYQILSFVFTFIIAVVSGAITGGLLKMITPWIGSVSDEYTNNDSFMWVLPEKSDDTKKCGETANIQAIHQNLHPIGVN